MANRKSGLSHQGTLVNKLSVKDAIHIVRTEGGPLSPGRLAFRVISAFAVAAFTARAILLGQATAWHLFLPMIGEYLVLLISLPIINLIIHDQDLRRDARQSLRWLIALLIILAIWIAVQTSRQGLSWPAQATAEITRFFRWITDHQMHWPILGASAAMAMSLPGRVAAFRQYGPPFVPVGMGCAMRIVIPLFGSFLLPWIVENRQHIVWVIWSVLLLSELGGLLMHWDLQRRLEKRGIPV